MRLSVLVWGVLLFAPRSWAAPQALPFLFDLPGSPKQLSSTNVADPELLSIGPAAARSGVSYVDPEHVGNLVMTMRESVCSKVGKGSIRMWLKLNATAQIVGIGGSSEGGVEVNIICGP